MKIKAKNIKPGMVIAIDRGDDFGDVCLVLATSGFVDVEYKHLDLQDAYDALIGIIKGETDVKVLKGKNRKDVIQKIKSQVFRRLHDIEATIDMIRLIEAMEEMK